MSDAFEYDLSAALPALRARGGQDALANAIERALWVASAHQDLSEAADALALLRSLTRGDGRTGLAGAERTTAAGCLFAQAVILYARATDTKPIERENWFGCDKLSGDDRELHLEVLELRNHALAHFGKAAEMPEGPLVGEALVMRRLDDRIGIAFYSTRAQNRARFARRLKALVEHVRTLAFEATQARYADLGAALAAASQADRGVPVLMRRFRFDPATLSEVPDWIDAFDKHADGAFAAHGAVTVAGE